MNGITGEPGIWPEQLLLTTRRRRPAEAPGLPNRVGRRSHQTGVWGVIGRARPVGVAGAVETRERVNEPPAGPVRAARRGPARNECGGARVRERDTGCARLGGAATRAIFSSHAPAWRVSALLAAL